MLTVPKGKHNTATDIRSAIQREIGRMRPRRKIMSNQIPESNMATEEPEN